MGEDDRSIGLGLFPEDYLSPCRLYLSAGRGNEKEEIHHTQERSEGVSAGRGNEKEEIHHTQERSEGVGIQPAARRRQLEAEDDDDETKDNTTRAQKEEFLLF